jgi:betaine-aldehyde dehydrogenase
MKVGIFQNYIDGKWVESVSGATDTISNPCDGELVTRVARSDSRDVDSAVAAAKRAFSEEDWAFNPRLRAAVLQKWANQIRANLDHICTCLSLESGKPLLESRIECNNAIGYMEYAVASARTLYGSTSTVSKNRLSIMTREPVGVVAGIEPWNYPITLMIRDSIPALAAGNTLIIKPAGQTSGASMEVIKLLVDNVPELPRGVVNAITGPGSKIGTALVEHTDVDMITFTGGLDTGKDIMEKAAKTMKRVSLELGGKSANVVFADCNMDKAVAGCAGAIFSNAGQTCTAGSRLVLEESIADEFLSRLKQVAENLKLGYCLDPDTKMGPVDNEGQLNKILNYIEIGKTCSTLLTGGYRYMENGCDKGYFIAPTIFVNPPIDSPIVQDEIFGPVLVVQTFRTEDEAVNLANCTRFGLCSGLWTESLNRAMAVSRRLRSGNVWVNNYTGFAPECETGGYKESGSDRAAGVDGFLKYTEIKHINMDFTR